MADTTRVAVFAGVLLLLQVSCAVSGLVNVPAVMTVNGFQQGEGGGGPAACDGQYHSDDEFVVTLSSKWFERGGRCGKMILIQDAANVSIIVSVVDECRGCHNEVGASAIIWRSFNLNTHHGEVTIRWSDVDN